MQQLLLFIKSAIFFVLPLYDIKIKYDSDRSDVIALGTDVYEKRPR